MRKGWRAKGEPQLFLEWGGPFCNINPPQVINENSCENTPTGDEGVLGSTDMEKLMEALCKSRH
jgi:hypothetical protein